MTYKSINAACRVCGGVSFNNWGARDGLVLYQCANCELVFFYPYPTQEELNEYYNDRYHDKRGYDGTGTMGGLRKTMYVLDAQELEAIIPVRGKFLDVGCAEGVFLTCLSNAWDKFGIDVSRDAIARATEKPGVTAAVKDLTELENSTFDVIHLRGVFEHILYPDEFVATACKKLKPSGYLVLSTTPNMNGPVPRLFRGRYKLVLPREHVNYFSPRTVAVLAARHGLSIVKITYPYWNTPYRSFAKDCIAVPFNYLTGKMSPPFFRNILSAYLKKTGT